MILKVVTYGGFALYDGFESLEYMPSSLKCAKVVKDAEGFLVCFLCKDDSNGAGRVYAEVTQPCIFHVAPFEDDEKFVHFVKGTQHPSGDTRFFFFDEGYICNDGGDTLDKLRYCPTPPTEAPA